MVSYDPYTNGTTSTVIAGPSHEDEHATGFCRALFNIIRDLFSALQLSGRVSDPESDEGFLAENEAGRFRLWGDGFDAREGGLDELLDGSGLHGAVVVQLAGIARKLRRYVDRDTELFRNLESTLEKAEYVFPEATEEEDEDLDLLETLEDIAVLNDGLYELTPFLETIPIEYEENGNLENVRLVTAGTEEITETKALQVNILDKFPEASFNLALVDRLADLNLRRRKKLWELKDKHEKMPEPSSPSSVGGGRGGTPHTPSSYAPSRYTDYTRGSSVPSISDSLFDDDYKYAQSEASSFADVDMDMVGRTSIPPPPVRLGDDVSFECNLCFQTLHGVHTKYLWKKHIFKDLQPYSCSFLLCPLPASHLFSSRTEWIDHEFAVHRTIFSWVCIKDCGQEFEDPKIFREHLQSAHLGDNITDSELTDIIKRCERRNPLPESQTTICPLCREEIPETKRSIRRHLGRHMEEISLAVVPPENYHVGLEESSEEEETSASEDEEEEVDPSEADSFEAEPSTARQKTKTIVAATVDYCIKNVIDRDTELLEIYDEPIWRSELFNLVEACDSRGKCLSMFTDELCRDAWTRVDGEPDIMRFRGDVASLADYNLFLDESVYDELQRRLKSEKFVLGFKRCHSCKEIAPPGRQTCPRCGHSHCNDCTSHVLPPSLRAQVEEQLRAEILPLLKSKKLMPDNQSTIGPSAALHPFINFTLAPPPSPPPPESTIPKTEFQTHARSWSEALEASQGHLTADDGFEVVGSRSNRSRRPSQSTYAGSADGSEIHADAITRTIVVDKKHYPLLIGSGGATLSDIIAQSGGPVQKTRQSRIVRFPRRDSPSNKVVLTGSPHVVDGIVERIKSKVAEFEGRKPRTNEVTAKDIVKERHEVGLEKRRRSAGVEIGLVDETSERLKREEAARRAAERKEKAGPSRLTISIGRSTSETDISGGRKVAVDADADYMEPEPRTTKSARRRHRKKKASEVRRAGDP
ncbi:hypothetical protein K440DRAFT_657620 [Wilcoxina mikolae CBS 423.85]|nr:hypothetical protein K440DRAFT_657620 [Wilcoxina mikolae CBS 423.85]